MKRLIVIPFLLISILGKPCGGGEIGDYYYSLMDQTLISMPEYYAFLNEPYEVFYAGYSFGEHKDGNVKLWGELLESWTEDEIYHVVYQTDFAKTQNVWEKKDFKLKEACKTYIDFAQRCSDNFSYRSSYSWRYETIKSEKEVDAQGLLTEANTLYKKEKNAQLKMRYAYQVVRILHYSGRNQDAINFFEKEIENSPEKNEIYYYTIDQVAGCYYNLENYEKAAYLYLQVFDKSYDRKSSATLSYRFCTNYGFDGKTLLKDTDDECAYVLMKAVRTFSDQSEGLNELYKLNPTDRRLELLFMRLLNEQERFYLARPSEYMWPNDRDTAAYEPLQKELVAFAHKMYDSPKTENKDYWRLCSSYLSFMAGDLDQANRDLEFVKGKVFEKKVAMLRRVYKAASWNKLDVTKENYIAETYFSMPRGDRTQEFDFVVDRTEQLYTKNGEKAKAFLVHNNAEGMVHKADMKLMNDLLAFMNRPKRSKYEEILAANAGRSEKEVIVYLEYIKGHYYLQAGEPEKALPLLNGNDAKIKSKWNNGNYGLVPAKIFSNNTTECFNCSEDTIMVDSVYLASVFAFIKPSFNRTELAKNLIKLDSIVAIDKGWKGKLANYLLGNYYFNACNTGYYRQIVTGYYSNTGNYIYMDEPYYVGEEFETMAAKASQYYRNAITLSSDKELNARCLYMIAKCELNTFYNEQASSKKYYWSWNGYDGGMDGNAKYYKSAFEELKKDYKDTEFYDQIIEECSFFKYYCSL